MAYSDLSSRDRRIDKMIGLYSKKKINWKSTVIIIFLSIIFISDNVESEEDQIVYKCEPMISPLCKAIYNETTVPGYSNTLSQEEALIEFIQFKPLIDYKCSPDLLPLLCSFYFPVCTILPVPIPPCRKLCLSAKSTCEPILVNFGFEWPAALSCSSFPMNENGLCVGQNTSTETKPSVTSVTGTATPNWNFPATGVTVSEQNLNKIRNEWKSHQENANGTYSTDIFSN